MVMEPSVQLFTIQPLIVPLVRSLLELPEVGLETADYYSGK